MDENAFNMSNGQSKQANRRKQINMNITAANGCRIEVTGLYQLPVTVRDKTIELDIFIVKNLSSKFILGMDFMKSANININMPTEKISMDGNVISTGFFNDNKSKCHSINSSGPTGSCTSQQHILAYSIAALKIKTVIKNEEVYITHKDNPYDHLVIYDTIGKPNDQGIVKIFVGNKGAEDLKVGRGVDICSVIKSKSFQAPSINEIKTEAKAQTTKIRTHLEGKAARDFLDQIKLKCPPEH